MGLIREPIFAALLTTIQGMTGWASPPSRRFRSIANVLPAEMPIAFIIGGKQTPQGSVRGQAYKWKVDALVVIYARTDDPSQAPSTLLNPILDALEKVLEQNAGDGPPAQFAPGQLGKANVLACRISDIEIIEGSEDGQGSALVDIELIAVP